LCATWYTVRGLFQTISKFLGTCRSTELKNRPGHFTRGGPLSPDLLITLLLYLIADGGRRGYRNLLDAFWDEAETHDLPLPTDDAISAAAFCKARKKLKPEALQSLLRDVVNASDQVHSRKQRFKGRRIFAIDGSKVSLQRAEELWQEFGGPTCGLCPQIMVSVLHNVISNVPFDATIVPCDSSERDQVEPLIANLRRKDVLVLDRGYPSHQIILMLLKRHIDFVIRVPIKQGFQAVHEFVESGGRDRRIVLGPMAGIGNLEQSQLEVRAVAGKGPDDEPQVFLTSLQPSCFSASDVRRLYRLRWQVELFYRLEKGNYLGHHQFHAKSAEGVRQEVYAMLLYVALTRHLMATTSDIHNVAYHEISQKGAILATAGYLTRLLLASDPRTAKHVLHRLLARISRLTEKKRPGRSFPRRSFKPGPRWGPAGRTG